MEITSDKKHHSLDGNIEKQEQTQKQQESQTSTNNSDQSKQKQTWETVYEQTLTTDLRLASFWHVLRRFTLNPRFLFSQSKKFEIKSKKCLDNNQSLLFERKFTEKDTKLEDDEAELWESAWESDQTEFVQYDRTVYQRIEQPEPLWETVLHTRSKRRVDFIFHIPESKDAHVLPFDFPRVLRYAITFQTDEIESKMEDTMLLNDSEKEKENENKIENNDATTKTTTTTTSTTTTTMTNESKTEEKKEKNDKKNKKQKKNEANTENQKPLNQKLIVEAIYFDDKLYRYGMPKFAKQFVEKIIRWAASLDTGYQKIAIHEITPLWPRNRYFDTYARLKGRYKSWVDQWTEQTDPLKFVFEDIAIASFLICLWEVEMKIGGKERKDVSFVDLGCGNGFLVYLLASEGFTGYGIDLQKRKIWDKFPSFVKLEHKAFIPTEAVFQNVDWLIGNHSDELTPWIPIVAYKSKANYFVLPCCFWDLQGPFTRKDNNKGRYHTYLEYVAKIGKQCGFNVEHETLSIPSTKSQSQVGRYRQSQNEKQEEIKQNIESLTTKVTNFKAKILNRNPGKRKLKKEEWELLKAQKAQRLLEQSGDVHDGKTTIAVEKTEKQEKQGKQEEGEEENEDENDEMKE